MKKKRFPITRGFLAATALLSAAMLVLTGCGAGASHTASASAETAAASAMDRASNFAAMPTNEYIAETAAAPMEGSAGSLTSETALQPVSANRKLIRNVDLNVETTEFDQLMASLQTLVTDLGGYIEQSNISGNSISSEYTNRRWASMTARIPSARLDQFIAQVDAQGNVTNRSEHVQDVTLQYTDIESRKKSLTIEQERLWDLLEKADSVDSIIALESRLSEIRYQLESFESQLRTYDNQVDYSTVYLNIDEVRVFTPTDPDTVMTRIQKGLQRNLESVGNGAVNFLIWFITCLPIFLVLAVILVIIVLIARAILSLTARHAEKRRQKLDTVRASVTPLTTGMPPAAQETNKPKKPGNMPPQKADAAPPADSSAGSADDQ